MRGLAYAPRLPCHIIEEGISEEISLAENAGRCPMHPADQYEAFAKLHTQHGMSAEDIGARFGVTGTVVKQRLNLGAISPEVDNALPRRRTEPGAAVGLHRHR